MSKIKVMQTSKNLNFKTRYYPKSNYPSIKSSLTTSKRKAKSAVHWVVFIVIFVYLWVWIIICYLERENKSVSLPHGSSKNKNKALTISLKKYSQRFETRGFEYLRSNPFVKRPKLTSSSIWLLKPMKIGKISLKEANGLTRLSKPTQVSVLVKYFIGNPTQSKLVATGKNSISHEEVTTELSQYGDGYCTRILFFGVVHEVFHSIINYLLCKYWESLYL
jgi:hypothetical protein